MHSIIFSTKRRIQFLLVLLMVVTISSTIIYQPSTKADGATTDPEGAGRDVAVPLPSGPGSERNFRPAQPATIASKLIQSYSRASTSYIIWSQESRALNPLDDSESVLDDSADIMGMDRTSNTPITVTAAPGRQDAPAISGSVVVWQQRTPRCTDCNNDIVGKNLATGTTFNVATGPNDQSYPAIDGTTVTWLESDTAGTHLLLKTFNTDPSLTTSTAAIEITNFPPSGELGPVRPVISSEYVIWGQVGAGDINTHLHKVQVQAYKRSSGSVTTLADYQQDEWSQPQYALDGHRLIWDQDSWGLHLRDLNTGVDSFLQTDGIVLTPSISGNTVLWAMTNSAHDFCQDIYGLHLDDPQLQALPLVTGVSCSSDPVASGDVFAWAESGGPDDGRVKTISLSTAFTNTAVQQAAIAGQAQLEQNGNGTSSTPTPTPTTTSTAPQATPEVPAQQQAAPLWTNYLSKGIYTPNGDAWLQPQESGQSQRWPCIADGGCPAIDALGARMTSSFFGSFIF